MLNSLRIQNFKSWQDTGDIQFGSITGFFGTNSSGKTSILQFLLMLKQTVESSDRAQILNLGDERSYVELGTMHDVIYNHSEDNKLLFQIKWNQTEWIVPPDEDGFLIDLPEIRFEAEISQQKDLIVVHYFKYEQDERNIGMTKSLETNEYILEGRLSDSSKKQRVKTKSAPLKFYIPPYSFGIGIMNSDSSQDLIFDFENLFTETYYLGPLREYPSRLYLWGGERPGNIGNRGAGSVAAILASNKSEPTIYMGEGNPRRSLEQHVAYWLKELGLIHSFEVRPIAPNRKEYEVRIKRTAESAEVFLTDVGFGVSQLLPVLVLLFYVPEGSTIILEQPEIHLHPAVQAGLADVFIDAIKRRNVQIILESHSEHLLQRLQRRLAEEALPTDQVKLYFTDFVGAASTLTPLDLDEYGNIRNWPNNFFGDSFADASAMMDAELKRREAAGEK
ncbi:DUF3696 domain-containing protein [Hymenobacter chitinivorans]|uniref:Uncharacterized protein DUF3696 n=1 Tax=Hymenobacter chitinivorans DSM 11115 TaxID=1121954 RepID=A0A2M9BPD0_9BACT|nr:DUF3696 domain-containing protein [Hymenobacter chitinivorans]PJJ59804.1 uncharacterized protein DUF3696 [Hymenobacter chitinivorans DSM 11115]